MTKLGTLSGYQGNVYRAYEGPDVGGFGLLPQSAVPKLSPDPNLPSELGLQSIDETLPSDYAGTKTDGGTTRLGTLSQYKQQAAAVVDPSAMAASTIAPKGGTPYQPNVTEDQMQEIYRRTMQEHPAAPDMSAAENLWRSGAKSYSNNLLAAPSLAQDIVPGARVLSYPGRKLLEMAGVPAKYTTFPRVDVDQISAATRAATSDLTYDEARENVRRAEEARETARPTSTTIGGLGGDVLTLSQGRAPFVGALRKTEVATERAIEKGVPVFSKSYEWPVEWRAAVKKSPGYNNLKKLIRRTGEAGVEGATIDALHQGGDPLQSAALTAGAQFAGGGAAQALMFKLLPLKRFGKAANFAVNTAVLGQVFYLADVALPGEAKDYEAQRSAAQKILGSYIVGGLLSTVTARARSGPVSVNMPRLTDALASAPRNAMQSYLVDYMNSDDTKKLDLKTKMLKLYGNIDKLSEAQLRDLSVAFGAGKDRFYNELDKATKDLP